MKPMESHLKVLNREGLQKTEEFYSIDPRAVVDPSAKIDAGCVVGPFAVIGSDVHLGPGGVVQPHAVIQGPATFGPGNTICSFACLGGAPQDLRHQGERTELVVGARNTFREYVTVNRGTTHGGGVTLVGDDNLIMAYSHVAHDCIIGNHVVMANGATLAGHVSVGDYAVFGGMVGVGAFLRIGESAMIAAGSMLEQEVPPFCVVSGDRAHLRAVNRVGLCRRGISAQARAQIKSIFRSLKTRSLSRAEIAAQFNGLDSLTPEAVRMLRFIGEARRGLAR